MAETAAETAEPLAKGLRRLIEGLPHHRALNLEVVAASNGRSTLRIPAGEHLHAFPDASIVHGGVLTTLLDAACGAAVITALAKFRTIATLDLRIDYLKPASPTSFLTAETECYEITRHIAFARGRVWQDKPDDTVAACAGTFMIGSVGFTPRIEG